MKAFLRAHLEGAPETVTAGAPRMRLRLGAERRALDALGILGDEAGEHGARLGKTTSASPSKPTSAGVAGTVARADLERVRVEGQGATPRRRIGHEGAAPSQRRRSAARGAKPRATRRAPCAPAGRATRSGARLRRPRRPHTRSRRLPRAPTVSWEKAAGSHNRPRRGRGRWCARSPGSPARRAARRPHRRASRGARRARRAAAAPDARPKTYAARSSKLITAS